MRHSIQWRLQTWHGAILLVALGGFLWVFHQAAWQEELRRVDQELGEQFELVLASPEDRREPPPGGPPPDGARRGGGPPPGARGAGQDAGPSQTHVDAIRAEIVRNIWRLESSRRRSKERDYYLFIDHDGTIFARSSNAPAEVPFPQGARAALRPSLIPGQGAAWVSRSRGDYREVFRVLPLGDALVIGRRLDEESGRLWRQLAWVAFAGFGLLSAGLVGGWWFTRVALAPIAAISHTATEIASGDLSRRISVDPSGRELAELADVLNQTFARLQDSFDRQTRFTSDASHELRTPISVILAKTQTTLHRERSAGEYQKALEVCQRAAERMRGLTESLLALSRLDAGSTFADRVDLGSVAREAAEFLSDTAATRGVTLLAEVSAAGVNGDASQLNQVITNLLTNAIQHSPAGATVTLRTGARAGQAFVEVLDEGGGIDPGHLAKIFERFYRAEESRSSPGFGLGLAIVRAIVVAHGGQVAAANRAEGGAVFTVTLPLAPSV